MYSKQFVVIFLALFFAPVLATAVCASAEKVPAKETTAAAGTEPAAVPEKAEEEVSFCSTNTLLKSDFIRTSVWPGIGPFDITAHNATEAEDDHKTIKLDDPAHNQLSCTTAGNAIDSCELELHNSIGEAQGLLNLQMGTDFLLEGLGVKPSQIHIVNMELSKKNKLLTGNNYNPVSIIIAPLTVTFQNLGKKEGTANPLFRVVILNQPKLYDKTATAEESSSKTNSVNNKTEEVDTANVPEPIANKTEGADTEKTGSKNKSGPKIDESGVITFSPGPTVNNPGTESGALPTKTSQPKTLSADETLKKEFLDLIVSWQRIKKTAVRQHQTDELNQALASKALIRQSDAIKWLASNHKYYEMLSQGATIEHVDSLITGKKYAVFAEVKEKSKYMDESTKQQLKETDDTYKVNYTIEKIGQHWLITDSALIKPGPKNSASKPGAKPKH